MTAQPAAKPADPDVAAPPGSETYAEGIVAGVLGASAIAVWFFVLDVLNGRPLYTPTVLGTAIFRGGAGLDSPGTLAVSGEMVFAFTWVHFLTFIALGGIAARLLRIAERNPNVGFGILLLFVYLETAFLIGSFLFAEHILHALAWSAVLAGNLLAALVMGAYFWRRHPGLRIWP